MNSITIREALAEDAAQLVEYMKIVGAETENLSFGGEGLPVSVEQEAAFLEAVHQQKTSVHLAAFKDGEIIGDGSLTGLPRRMSHRAELGLTVKKAYWSQGVGSALMGELIRYAEEKGIELLNLEVKSDNIRAVRLYESFGFRRIGTSPAYFKIGGRYSDFELMYLDLRKDSQKQDSQRKNSQV